MASSDELPGVEVSLKALPKVLSDTSGEIKKSGKCVLVIDHTERASTFLQYQEVNYLTALNQEDMSPERIRLAIIGGLRYGKKLIFDLLDLDTFPVCRERMNEIQAGLMDSLLDGSIQQDEKIAPLIKESDGPDYHIDKFADCYKEKFNMVVVTTKQQPSEELLKNLYVLRVC